MDSLMDFQSTEIRNVTNTWSPFIWLLMAFVWGVRTITATRLRSSRKSNSEAMICSLSSIEQDILWSIPRLRMGRTDQGESTQRLFISCQTHLRSKTIRRLNSENFLLCIELFNVQVFFIRALSLYQSARSFPSSKTIIRGQIWFSLFAMKNMACTPIIVSCSRKLESKDRCHFCFYW